MVRSLSLVLAACVALGGPCGARAQDDPICADRPGKAFASCSSPKGRLQLETQLADGAFLRQDGVTTDTWMLADPTLKYGVSDRLDVEAEIPLYVDVRTRDVGGVSHARGVGDLTLAAKYSLTGNDGAVTAALRPYLLFPTARRDLGADGVQGGVAAPVQWKLNDAWSLVASPEADIVRNDGGSDGGSDGGGGSHVQMIQLVGVGRQLTKALTLSAELWGLWSFEGGGRLDQASADLAVSYLVDGDLQLDVGVNAGLNRRTPGAEVYAGVSRRF